MTYRVRMRVPRTWRDSDGELVSRAEFYASSGLTGLKGFQGLWEGTVLEEEHLGGQGPDASSGAELDAALPPSSRDWTSDTEVLVGEIYFDVEPSARAASSWISTQYPGVEVVSIEEVPDEDWNQTWKDSFKGIRLKGWTVLPPWEDTRPDDPRIIRLNPGAGFGTGTHETTQLCLEALLRIEELSDQWVLDFGSGSGVLSLAAAFLGARVTGVEIDPDAIANAEDNLALNSFAAGRINYLKTLDSVSVGSQRCVIANILKSVLIPFAPEVVKRVSPKGDLILSGLIGQDVDEVRSIYQDLMSSAEGPEVTELGDWRCLHWRRVSAKVQ